jgi:hypothetical protein
VTAVLSNALRAAPVAAFAALAALAMASVAVWAGLVPNDTITLWAGALIAGDGGLSLGRIVAAYPTLPFIATVATEFVVPAGAPSPALLASAIVGLIAGVWFIAFRRAGIALWPALTATALLVFHPALIQAATAGPSETLVALFLFMLGTALFDLRQRGAAPEVMLVSLALLGLAFSHPMGAAIACAIVPLLVFAVRPMLVANSALNVIVALVFPVVFSVAAFAYVSWIFPGNGWSFYSAPAQSLSAWAAGMASVFGVGLTGVPALDAAVAFTLALLLGAPLAFAAGYRVRHRVPLIAPPAVLAGATIAAAALSIGSGWFGDPAAVAVAAPVLCAVMVIRIPAARERSGTMLTWLMLGWLGGALALVLINPRVVLQIGAAGDPERLAALNLGHATAERAGVMIDTDNAPAAVVGRATARDLLPPATEAFELSLLFHRLDAPFVAVPDPQSAAGINDRINRAFPLLYRQGAADYRVVYANAVWRLYARTKTKQTRQGTP